MTSRFPIDTTGQSVALVAGQTIALVDGSGNPLTYTGTVPVSMQDGQVYGPISSTVVPGTTVAGVLQTLDMLGQQSLTVDFVAPSASGITFIVEGCNTGQPSDLWYPYTPVIVDAPSANSATTLTSSLSVTHSYAYTRYHRFMRVRRLTTSGAGNISIVLQTSTSRVPNQTSGIAPGGATNEGNAYAGSGLQVNEGVTRTSNSPTASGGVYTIPTFTTGGAALQKPYSVPEADWLATSGLTPLTATTSTPIKAAGAAGIRNYMTAIQLSNSSSSQATTIAILDGATVIHALNLLANDKRDIEFPSPLRGSAATAMNIQCGSSASIYWNAQGYQAP